MPFACNINSKGKRLRLINGIILLAIGLASLFLWSLPHSSLIAWIITVLLVLAGAFSIFESAIGWCAVRAMGIKTKI